MKSKVQITLASIVAITLLTTGIVYANDDLIADIEKAIDKLTKADKQQNKQIKQHNKEIKNLNKQIDDLQQTTENLQKKIQRLKDFRDNTRIDMQDTHSEMNVILNELIVRPMSESALITLDETIITQGDYLEFNVNLEPIFEEFIDVDYQSFDSNATLEYMNFMIYEPDLFEIQMQYYGANNTQNQTEGWIIDTYDYSENGGYGEKGIEYKWEYTNDKIFTIKIPIPNDNKIGLHNVYISQVMVQLLFEQNETMIDLTENYPYWLYYDSDIDMVVYTKHMPGGPHISDMSDPVEIDLQYIMTP